MDTLLTDLRFALRQWVRNPGFVTLAVLTLALGIGANTTMFSIAHTALLRPLPFPAPERLVTLWKGRIDNPKSLGIVSLPDYRDWQARARSFESLALFDSAGRGYNLTGHGEPEQVSGLRVTASFFKVLGVSPLLGRTFTASEEQPGTARVVVLSHALWTRSYGADPGIVGRTVSIDSAPFTVIGVMPAEFRFQFWGPPRQLWVPAGWTAGDQERNSHSFIAIGRLKPGVELERARSEMNAIGLALAAAYPADNAGRTVRVVPMSEYGLGDLQMALLVMMGIVGFVLLIACVNVANLMLARAAARQRELSVRSALGAGRGRILRQLFTESLLLAAAGGTAGLVVALWTSTFLFSILPRSLTSLPLRPLDRVDLDPSVLGFTASVAALSGVLFGLAPALAVLRANISHPLKDGARGSTAGGHNRLRYALVASEVALTLVTLAGAGVMILSVARLLGVDPGLDPRNVLVMQMSVPQENLYYGPPGNPRFCANLEQQVGSLPGVVSASAIAHLPLGGGGAGRGIVVEGRPDPGPEKQPGAGYSVACPDVLRTLGIELREGREFTQRDTLGAPGVALVNEAMAREFWPGEQAVGKRFKTGRPSDPTPWLTVVGVYRNVRHYGLDDDFDPAFLCPYQQAGWPMLTVVVKTAGAPLAFAAPVKRALSLMEPDQPVSPNVRTMEAIVAASVSSRRFPMLMLSAFASLALLLAAIGIGGVVGYTVVQRTPEIGVRMALGARPRDVMRLVVGHSLRWTALGVVVGLAGAAVLLRLLDKLVYGVAPTDPMVLAAVSTLLLLVGAAASYLPARRAMRVDPVSALRYE